MGNRRSRAEIALKATEGIPTEALEAGVIAELLEALKAILDHYVQLAGCGDCGHWNPEDEQIVKDTRALIAKAEGSSDE